MLSRVIVLIATVLTLAIATSSSTSGHADLERSIPEAGAELGQPPAQVEMWFSEEIAGGSTAVVSGPDGERADNDDAAIDLFDPERKHLVVTLMSDLLPGTYVVTWTTVSGEDDDSFSGSFEFTLAVAATPAASPAAVASPIASPKASPATGGASQDDEETAADSPAAGGETAGPDTTAVILAVAVGFGAAAVIYVFWRLVRPHRQQKLDG